MKCAAGVYGDRSLQHAGPSNTQRDLKIRGPGVTCATLYEADSSLFRSSLPIAIPEDEKGGSPPGAPTSTAYVCAYDMRHLPNICADSLENGEPARHRHTIYLGLPYILRLSAGIRLMHSFAAFARERC